MARRHHQVPEFYLNFFAGFDPRGSRHLWVYDKTAELNPRRQTPENTTVEKGYYSFDTRTGIDERLEGLLGELEAKACPLLKRLQDTSASLSYLEIGLLSEFLTLLHLRVPRLRNAMIEHMEIEALETARLVSERPELLKRFLEEKRPVLDDRYVSKKELAEVLRDADRQFQVKVDPKAALINVLKAAGALPPLLYRMNWIICDAPARTHFVTSDAPLCVYLPTGPSRAIFGGGFGRSEVQISFPISPKVLLLIDWRHGRESCYRTRVNEGLVIEMNKRMAWNAERFLISAVRDPSVEASVDEAKVTVGKPKLDRRVLGQFISARIGTALDRL